MPTGAVNGDGHSPSRYMLQHITTSTMKDLIYCLEICSHKDWTVWYDVDKPTGYGDYETLRMIALKRNPELICNNPTHIEGRVVGTNTDATESGDEIILNPSVGLICKNKCQTCKNYEVRFCCPESKLTMNSFFHGKKFHLSFAFWFGIK